MKKLLLLFCCLSLQATKVLIITHNYNRPDFIEIQYKTFKKFLNDDYEYVVFNDAKDPILANKISAMCSQYEIRCIQIPQDIHTRPYLPRQPHDNLQQANIRHANCVQYSMDLVGFDFDGIVCIIDSDMFPIRSFSISNYMENKDIAAFIKRAPQGIYCLCPAFCFLSMHKLPEKKSLDFNTGLINSIPVDSGGYTYHYLSSHPEVKLTQVNVLYSHQLMLGDSHIGMLPNNALADIVKVTFYQNMGFSDNEINFFLKKPDAFEFYLDNNFIHYRDGSNNTNQSKEFHAYKLKIFNEFIDAILNY